MSCVHFKSILSNSSELSKKKLEGDHFLQRKFLVPIFDLVADSRWQAEARDETEFDDP